MIPFCSGENDHVKGAVHDDGSQHVNRIASIDALRGFVMVLMLVDHVRETFFLHMQVGDPVDISKTDPWLFLTRLTSSLCAPIFIFLAGTGAAFFQEKHSIAETSTFLLKRGLFLILLEIFIINFAWVWEFPAPIFYLQVIWCIGLCMVALAALIHLPRFFQLTVGVLLIAGHHLLDHIRLQQDHPFFVLWAILHQRAIFDFIDGIQLRTSYPIMPWIGVILLGYCFGKFYKTSKIASGSALILAGILICTAFFILRWINIYGDQPWVTQSSSTQTILGFFALTKYPPSLLFTLFTLGVGAVILAAFRRYESSRLTSLLANIGGAPLFFYILHLYVLKLLYLFCLNVFGTNQAERFSVDHVSSIWLISLILIVPLYFITAKFTKLKQRRRDLGWLKYL